MLGTFVKVLIVFVILGALVPVLWPLFVGSDTDIQAMTEVDDATVLFQTIWPIALLVTGIGLAISVVVYALKKFGIMG